MNMTEYRKGRMAYRDAYTLTGRESYDFDRGYWDEHDLSFDETVEEEAPECLDANRGDCEGPVEYRMPMSPTGVSYARCGRHFDKRMKVQRRISHRYSLPMYY